MSLGAIPGTGPATSPMPIIRKSTARTMADLPSDRTLVMGILNINDDSFSDGGKYLLVDDAISHGLAMYYGGADIIDIGGESTRPGAVPVDPAVEQARILPVITALAKAGAIISVDTMHTSTARAALAAGAHIINDVSGLTHEPDMPALMAQTGAPYVLMHRRGDAGNMVTEANYTDVVSEVLAELEELRSRFIAAGVKPEALILDPGLGFAKDHEHNWDLLRALDRFTALGHRVLVGTSRKRFLGELLRQDGKPAAPAERDAATAATSALAAANGAWGVRVHDVPSSLAAIKVAGAWMNSRIPAL